MIKGLIQLNGEQNRENERYDISFIKALLVGLIGINKIVCHGIESSVVKFIEGSFSHLVSPLNYTLILENYTDLFQYRVNKTKQHEKRQATFESLLSSAISSIQKSNYNR